MLYTAVATPLLGMKLLILKKRKTILKYLIFLQISLFFIHWFIVEIYYLKYLYMLLVFENFTEKDYAFFSVFNDLSSTFFLMFVIPFLNAKLRLHDALMLIIVLSAEATAYAILPSATVLWQFYIPTFFGALGYCKYAIIRSLLSKCIEPDEVGKVFSIMAVVAALAPSAGNPVFRQLYNATIDSVPGAIYYLASSLLLVTLFGTVFIYIVIETIFLLQ